MRALTTNIHPQHSSEKITNANTTFPSILTVSLKPSLFSRDEGTYMSVCPLVGSSVDPSVTLSLFGLLGVTNAVYTALVVASNRVGR